MDYRRFDTLGRVLATSRARRAILGALFATTLAPLGVPAAAKPKGHSCLPNGRICGKRKTKKRKGKKRQDKKTPACSTCCSRFSVKSGKVRRCRCKPAGRPCGQDQQCCTRQCIDTQTNSNHCGSGGTACGAGQICEGGSCQSCDVCASDCPFTSVQAAINAANGGATIRLCPGTHAGLVTVNKSLSLIGSGTSDTILDGEEAGTVVTVSAGRTVHIRHLAITGGKNAPGLGGGLLSDGTLTLEDVTVMGNSASFGGGSFNRDTLTLDRGSVSENSANFEGGGIFNIAGGRLTLLDSSVTGNSLDGPGGGIINEAMLIVDGSTIAQNAAIRGGGIFNALVGTVILAGRSRATGNTAGDTGGGVFNMGDTVTIVTGSKVTGNSPDTCAGPGPIPDTCQNP